ncbi:spore coat U domain-containing protein [Dyella sp. ASV21]|uniref:spore coat protein U domain-containing protein n=1 Tax=Dyella sp. ASV21 TaxID=2795114 RepID=UPI0018EDD09B
MRSSARRWRRLARWGLICACAWGRLDATWASTCAVEGGSSNTVNFGLVNPLDRTDTKVSGKVRLHCTLTSEALAMRACLHLGLGDGSSSLSSRSLRAAAYRMSYNLYADGGYTQLFGPPQASAATAVLLVHATPGPAYPEFPVFALLPGAQSATPLIAGDNTDYVENYGGDRARVDVQFAAVAAGLESCPLVSPSQTLMLDFNVRATVQKNCTVTASDMDFSAAGPLSRPLYAQGSVRLQCTQNSAYAVALSGGVVSNNPLDRQLRRRGDSETMHYQLYADAARQRIWGDGAAGTASVAGVGTGAIQEHVVYGMVPAQVTPSPGEYSDSVIVTVTF